MGGVVSIHSVGGVVNSHNIKIKLHSVEGVVNSHNFSHHRSRNRGTCVPQISLRESLARLKHWGDTTEADYNY